MKERYDVVVVGAGPSGLLAAKAVAENGFDVAVVERKEKIEVIGRTCGQTLLPPNDYFFGDLFHYNARDKRFCFPKSGLSFPYSGPIKNLYDWYMYSPGMKRMHFGYPEGYTPPIPGMLKAPIESLRMTGELREFRRAYNGAMWLERVTPETSAASKRRHSA